MSIIALLMTKYSIYTAGVFFRFKKLLFLILFLVLAFVSKSSKLEKAYEALRIYDYFLAKKIFTEIQQKKADAYCSYGLSLIYSRTDNPFSNIDSAGKYILLTYHTFQKLPLALSLSGFTIDKNSILLLADSIAAKMYEKMKQSNTVSSYEFFLSHFYLCDKNLKREAVLARDQLEYKEVVQLNQSKLTADFIKTHPQSELFKDALVLLDHQVYEELCAAKTASAYMYFINSQAKNIMMNTALEKLFAIYVQSNDVTGLAGFVKNYPNAPQAIEAWKLLFSLSVKDFSFSELDKFIAVYPQFPLKASILNELELNKLMLYPYQIKDFFGFIDTKGKLLVKAVFDAVSDFHEGLSVVSKNDSVYFINKRNENPFAKVFSDALVFRNGIAPVKENNSWYFINRQGQSISTHYDEINELSENVYVVKVNGKYGALDHFGQVILEPRFDKLGDFKNGFAYYTDKGNYGFVSRSGFAHKAEFEWISDFNDSQVAIFQQNNKYGLVNNQGNKILEAKYDMILKTNSSLFIVVANSQYGFYSSEGCFLTAIAYDFIKERAPEYYTNGNLLRLIKKGEQAFVDTNGRINIIFGAYQEINFAYNELIRVKQKNKYGYVDRKLNPVILYKYFAASDFSDSVAMVKFKDLNILINTRGAEIFSSNADITKISKHYYLVDDELRSLINSEGEMIYSDVDNVQKTHEHVYIITLNNGEIKLLVD